MFELPPTADLQKKLRIDYLDTIMKDKPYKANQSQFKDWFVEALKEEVNIIEMMKKDPQMKKSAPNWNKYKTVDVDDALRCKRKRAELVAAGYRPARSIARWSKENVDETYRKLEKLRKTDPTVPQKPAYIETTADRPQQTHAIQKLFSSSFLPICSLNQLKRQKQTNEEDEERCVEHRKEAIKNQVQFGLDDASQQLVAQISETIKKLSSRPQSPNSSQIKLLPRKPSDPKILKCKYNKDTHVLTLIRSDVSVEKLSRKAAYGLNAGDLQDLLNLQLHRDEEDTDSLDFELQFKGQIWELLMRE
ncbi:hypothetical protein Hanom_Chr16g01464671 [Helianthus anomalus]